MTNPLVRIAELEAALAELKKQLQEDGQLYGRLGTFTVASGNDYTGVCVDNKPDSDGDVRMFYLDRSGETEYAFKRVDDVEWLTGKALTSSEEIDELPIGTVVCFTKSPKQVAVRVFESGLCWRRTDGLALGNDSLAEGVEVIRYGTGIGN